MSKDSSSTVPLHNLSAFQRDLLRLIEMREQPYGLTLKRAIEAAWDVPEVTHSRVYQNLDKLVGRGLVEKGKKDDRTNYYQITTRGRHKLDAPREWLATDCDECN